MMRIIRILIIAFGMMVALGGSSLFAQTYDEGCEHRIHEARERLENAVQQYGADSREARERHEQLEEIRQQCNGRDNDGGRVSESCEHRIHEARERLEYAIQQYGQDSPQARERHEELERARRHCNQRDEDDRR